MDRFKFATTPGFRTIPGARTRTPALLTYLRATSTKKNTRHLIYQNSNIRTSKKSTALTNFKKTSTGTTIGQTNSTILMKIAGLETPFERDFDAIDGWIKWV